MFIRAYKLSAKIEDLVSPVLPDSCLIASFALIRLIRRFA
jgi:hypothetical protein